MDEKAKQLAESVLAWWQEHRRDTCYNSARFKMDVYRNTPDFVIRAAEYLGRDTTSL